MTALTQDTAEAIAKKVCEMLSVHTETREYAFGEWLVLVKTDQDKAMLTIHSNEGANLLLGEDIY